MSAPAPRLEVDLGKIAHNARSLVAQLQARGMSVTGITKATLGSPAIAEVMRRAGVRGIGDSRIGNIRRMVNARVNSTFLLTRSPSLSEVDEVVNYADISFNSELGMIARLSTAARQAERHHGVILMVEMGDLREGLMPRDLAEAARLVIDSPHLFLRGIGCNLACYGGIAPDAENMAALSALANELEAAVGMSLDTISGGNSANLDWALGSRRHGRINNLRLGESILLGRETLQRHSLPGLHTDAFRLVAEVIESKPKPGRPWGQVAQSAFGNVPVAGDEGEMHRAILALGRQDCDPEGLTPPPGIRILGASSDHLIVESLNGPLALGSEHVFLPDYSALLRATSSPSVHQIIPATTRIR